MNTSYTIFCRSFVLMLLIGSCLTPFNAQVKLWGLTSSGGQGAGSIINMDEDGTNFSSVHFPFNEGRSPSADLLNASNGKFYGMTTDGGNNFSGVIFEYNTVTNAYQVLHHFTQGSNPKGSLIEMNGNLIGQTSGGGNNDLGVIFEYNLATNNYVVLYEFGSSIGDGTSPQGSLVQLSGKLYGMTLGGGANDFGTIFQYDPSTDIHTVIHSFTDIEGSYPYGSLLVSGQSLLGLTSSGGDFLSGVLFDYNIEAGSIDILHHFETGSPFGSLIMYDGKFYGMTASGGENFAGSIFEYDPIANQFSTKFSFDNDAFGSYPFGSLVESTGKLYGMTNSGGSNFGGVLFEYDVSLNNYNILHQFDPVNNGGGASPSGSLILSDGKLYGLTSGGGTAGFGSLFEYNISGGQFNAKVIFENAPFGSSPKGDLTKSGNIWYGMASNGGNFNNGTIFIFDPAGSGTMGVLHQFSGMDGAIPTGNLLLFNGNLYGMTSEGGNNNGGVLFEFNLTTSIYTVKHHFNNGNLPMGSLIEINGVFYGLTSNGGTGFGNLFMFNPTNNTYTSVHTFNGAQGKFPFGDLVQMDGLLYGMTTTANTHPGVLFRFDPNLLTFEVMHYFSGGMADGGSPYGSLVIRNGILYGMTRDGGNQSQGTIFRYDPAGIGSYSVIYELANSFGGNPEGSLTVVGNQLFGMTKLGGSFGGGVIFKLDSDNMNYQVLKHFNNVSGRSPFGSLSPSGCINPIITSVNADVNPISCAGNASNLSVSGNLHGANDWKWYTSSCGGTLVGTGSSINVMPATTTTYYVRGEGGCATESGCSSITLNIAVPIVVNKNDAGAGSLRAAITCTGEGGTIVFDPLVLGANDTISISSASLEINKNISINQSPSTIVKIKATGPHPIFSVIAGKSLTLNYADLFMNPNSVNVSGRAILNSGNLLMSNINIRERSQNLGGNGSTVLNQSGGTVNISSSNQIIIQN